MRENGDDRDTTTVQRTAMNELGRILLSEQSLDDVLNTVVRLAREAVDGAEEVSVTLHRDGVPYTAAFTGAVALGLDERQYAAGFGPCLSAAQIGDTIRIDDTARESTYDGFAAAALAAGIGSTFSVGLPLPTASVGAINCYSSRPHGFEHEARTAAMTLAGAAAVTLSNAALYADARDLAEQMVEAMRSRAVIEQAKGVLLRDNRCTPDEAFAMLVTASNRSNRKLRDIAQALVDGASRGT